MKTKHETPILVLLSTTITAPSLCCQHHIQLGHEHGCFFVGRIHTQECHELLLAHVQLVLMEVDAGQSQDALLVRIVVTQSFPIVTYRQGGNFVQKESATQLVKGPFPFQMPFTVPFDSLLGLQGVPAYRILQVPLTGLIVLPKHEVQLSAFLAQKFQRLLWARFRSCWQGFCKSSLRTIHSQVYH